MTADPAERVALATRALAVAGDDDMVWGHVGLRDPDGRGVWMKAAGWGLEEVDATRVLLIGWRGELLAGDGPAHIESAIHLELLRARPDVGAVVHTHAPSAVAFASLDRPLRPISHEACLFSPPDVPRFTRSAALIADGETGTALATTVGDGHGALIPGHGLVAVGADEALAVMTAVFLARACRAQLAAESAGGPALWSSDEEALRKRATTSSDQQLLAGWRYLVRRIPVPGGAAP